MSSLGQFHWTDYLIFAATLLISILIGLYYAFRKGGQKTTKDYLQGDRKMPVIPTALSLLVSFQSGILILGISSEMYVKGTNYAWYLIGVLIGIPLAALVYQPIFYKLKLTSAYEYLELRFRSRLIRLIGSFLFISSTLMYMAIVLYAPATALNQVSGIHLELLIVVSGLACTFYTTMVNTIYPIEKGGLKAVVWTDAFQAVVMYAGLIAVIVKGTLDVGGAKKVWDKAYEGGRLLIDLNPNPFTYMNFWAVVFGTAFGWMSVYGTNQTAIQRYTSLKTLRKAQMSLLFVVPGMFTLCPLVMIAGLVMYAYYADCDPMELKLVSNRDQLLPFFVVDILGHISGLPGVFLACLYSGTLSTVSSGLNSLAAVVWEDILKSTKWGKRLTEKQATNVTKSIACCFGFIGIALACVAKFLGGVFQAALTVLSMLGGPLAGLFLFGMVFPWANMPGALVGVIGSSGIMAWICIGAQIIKPYRKNLPTSIAGCSNITLQIAGAISNSVISINNHSIAANNATLTNDGPQDLELFGMEYVYKLSYKMYGLAAIIFVFLIGIPVSLLTSKGLDERDKDFIWPGLRYFCGCWLSKRWKNMLRYAEREAYESEHQLTSLKDKPEKLEVRRSKQNLELVNKVLENNENYRTLKEQAYTETLDPLMRSYASISEDFYLADTTKVRDSFD